MRLQATKRMVTSGVDPGVNKMATFIVTVRRFITKSSKIKIIANTSFEAIQKVANNKESMIFDRIDAVTEESHDFTTELIDDDPEL